MTDEEKKPILHSRILHQDHSSGENVNLGMMEDWLPQQIQSQEAIQTIQFFKSIWKFQRKCLSHSFHSVAIQFNTANFCVLKSQMHWGFQELCSTNGVHTGHSPCCTMSLTLYILEIHFYWSKYWEHKEQTSAVSSCYGSMKKVSIPTTCQLL